MSDEICDIEGCEERASISGTNIKACKQHYDELWAWHGEEERQLTELLGGPWDNVCPRRDEVGGATQFPTDLDAWRFRRDYKDEWVLTCGYCGSLHPDLFLERVRNGEQVIPTDKSYKAYLGASGTTKFYYQHLSDDQRREFVDLINNHTMNVGYPGHFYRLPFFVAKGGEQS